MEKMQKKVATMKVEGNRRDDALENVIFICMVKR